MMGDYVTLKQCVFIHIISILEQCLTVFIFTPIMSEYVTSILISLPCICIILYLSIFVGATLYLKQSPTDDFNVNLSSEAMSFFFIYSFRIPNVGQWSDWKVYLFQNKVLILTNNIFKLFVGFCLLSSKAWGLDLVLIQNNQTF